MNTFYVLAAVLATPATLVVAARYVGISERARYRMRLVLGRLGMLALLSPLLVAGCDDGTAPPVNGDAGTGGSGGGTQTTSTTTGCAAGFADCGAGCVSLFDPANCGGCNVVCSPTQSCGPGCANGNVGVGCFTPGGTLNDAGPNDCPACFADPGATINCSGPNDGGFPRPYFCQLGASIGGCVPSAVNPSYICCPPSPDGGQ